MARTEKICGEGLGQRRSLRAVARLLLLLTIVGVLNPAALAQEPRASHHWIVLLDVSASFEKREHQASGHLAEEGYRLRSEALFLLQTLLAARRVKELELRDDRLSVYVFGRGVDRIQALTTQPVRWAEVKDPSWWETQIPQGLGARTNYFEALRTAIEAFKEDLPGTAQHLVLLSDGELDVEPNNRNPGAPPAQEEMAVYKNLLRRDVDPLNWLHDQRVQIHTLAVDEGLAGYNDNDRQQQIRAALYDYQFVGPTPLERARALVEDFAGKVGPQGKLEESEGPYVMAALAQAFNGSSRSVRSDNVLDVLWQTLFPEQTSRRILPLGTNSLIVFAPLKAPVPLRLEEDGQIKDLSLIYDPTLGRYSTDPMGTWKDLQVQVLTTTQYATWLIHHPNLREVDAQHQLGNAGETFSLVAVTNVAFRWQQDHPPGQVLGNQPVTLTADLVWLGAPPEPSRDTWRTYLDQTPLQVAGQVDQPDGSAASVSFSPIVLRDESPAVLRLIGSFQPTQEGSHEARLSLRLGEGEEAPELKTDPVRFDVFNESPLSRADRFVLHLRRWQGGQPGATIALPRSQARVKDPVVVWTEGDEAVTVVFEWWGQSQEDCKGVDRLSIILPDFNRAFGDQENEILPDARPHEGDLLVCYRSPGVRVEPERWDSRLKVEATDELVQDLWWHWQVKQKTPLWVRVLSIAGPLLLLLFLLLAWLLRHRIAQWHKMRTAPFPLALDLPEGTLEWATGQPKRLVVSLDAQGQPNGELSRRRPGPDEHAVVIAPESKHTFRLSVAAGPQWTMQRFDRDKESQAPRPLTRTGETVTLIDLTRGTRLRLTQDKATVTLRHR